MSDGGPGPGSDPTAFANISRVKPWMQTPKPAAPLADFSANNLTPTAAQTVTFTDLSTNNPVSWLWEKNSGSGWVAFTGNSTARNPTQTFAAGTWSIRLTATTAGGSNTRTRTNYIVATSPLTGHDIVSITDNGGGTPRVTTAAAHGLAGNESITVSGTVTYDGGYNGSLGEFTVIDATHFDLTTAFYGGDTTGGRWD